MRTEVTVIRAQGETFHLSVCPSPSCLEALWAGWPGWVLPWVLAEAHLGSQGRGSRGTDAACYTATLASAGSAAAAAPEKRLLWDEKVLNLLAAPPRQGVSGMRP